MSGVLGPGSDSGPVPSPGGDSGATRSFGLGSGPITTKMIRIPPETVIEMKDVTVRSGPNTLLDKVSMEFKKGEILGLVFSHGLGKSTLLRTACGFFEPDEGTVTWRGKDVSKFNYEEERDFQRKTGFVFQNGGLLVNTKIYENVAMPLRYMDFTEKEIEEKVRHALGTVGMADAADRFPWELTTARQKLCTLARALVREPDIIFFDNFFKGTEADVWHMLTRLVRHLRGARGIGWVLVLEADPAVYQIADRLAIIENGKVLDASTPSQLKQSKDVRITGVFKTLDWTTEGEE